MFNNEHYKRSSVGKETLYQGACFILKNHHHLQIKVLKTHYLIWAWSCAFHFPTSVSSHTSTRPCSKPRRATFNREERRVNFVSHRCITSRDFMQERPVFLTVSTILRLDEANQNKFNTTNSINC